MLIEDKKDYALQLFAKVEHGFALRGNQNDPYERKYSLLRIVLHNLKWSSCKWFWLTMAQVG